ncbi:MAG: hypothetical protein GTO03_03815, partial [Planctomycetales bacterium]|nr:hypothetical protein [Planctomycetales bacterium]
MSILQRLEEREITAEEAARLMGTLEESKLAGLAPSDPTQGDPQPGDYVRLRVSNLASGVIETDLRLPLGLVNAALDSGGRLSTHLDRLD